MLVYNLKLPVVSILISFLKMACPCCLEMICTVRTDHYLRVPGCLVPHVWTCTFWCCAKMYHLHLSTGKHEVALRFLAQLKRYKRRSSFCSLCLYLSVQGAMTCTRDDQAGAWNPCFVSTHEFSVPPLLKSEKGEYKQLIIVCCDSYRLY